MRYTDLMSMKNDKVRGEIIRERLAKVIYKAITEECGEDFARLIVNEVICPTGENTEQTFPKNSIVADVGDITDRDGFAKGALVNITIKVLNWNDVKTAKTDRTALTFNDVLDGIDKAEEKAKKTAEENAEKEKRKQAQIERDKLARAKRAEQKKAKTSK